MNLDVIAMNKIFFLQIYLLAFLVISCEKEESVVDKPLINPSVSVLSFSIDDNISEGVFTSTRLDVIGNPYPNIENHGTVVLQNNKHFIQQNLGKLNTENFESVINKNLIKGQQYTVYPFIYHDKKYVTGDTIPFISNVDINVEIEDFYPTSGFVYDTITIKGKNFCVGSADFKNRIILNGIIHGVIFESDTLIKAIVSPSIKSSKLVPVLKSCNFETVIDKTFLINEPIFDSISSKETYVGESLFIYGKNFHSNFSEVWINNIVAPVKKNSSDIDKLEVIIPQGLPTGLLDLKIKVLDRVIVKEEIYQSTTPFIEKLSNYKTGFLEEITIIGDYFNQPERDLKLKIGGKEQSIFKYTRDSISVLIDRVFRVSNPKLEVIIGEFEMNEAIQMLPPQILSIDKEKYNLENDTVNVKTRYFLADSYEVKVGESGIAIGESFDKVEVDGNFPIPLNKWLNAGYLYPNYEFDSTGEIKIDLETAYGSVSTNFKVYEPIISSINNKSFFHGSHIKLEGTNLGYRDVGKIFIDGIMVNNPYNSSYTLGNTHIDFKLPETYVPGNYTLLVETGGQLSNEIDFELKDIIVSTGSIQPFTGTRRDIFKFGGINLESSGSYSLFPEDNPNAYCSVLSSNHTEVTFSLPYSNPLTSSTKLKLRYGLEIMDVGEINGIEPYNMLDNYVSHPNYYEGSCSFEYNQELYFFNRYGIYKFNLLGLNWIEVESNMPEFKYGFSNNHQSYASVCNDTLYFTYGDVIHTYNLISKTWDSITKKFNNSSMCMVHEGEMYFVERGPNGYEFKKYNLTTNEITSLSQPSKLNANITGDIFYYSNGKIFMDLLQENIMVYDIATDNWEDIGHPKTPYLYFYANNLYVYKNKLYFTGGLGNGSPEYNMYTYNFDTKRWTEKTWMLQKLRNQTIFGVGDYLYILFGGDLYGYENQKIMRYHIPTDPY